jgi:hypothetical protein
VTLGLLFARPVVPATQAQAPAPMDLRCVGFDNGPRRRAEISLHNPAADDTTAQIEWLSSDGTIRETISIILPSGQTPNVVRRREEIGIVAKITSPSNQLVIDAQMIYDDDADEEHRRTVTCGRVS